MLLIVLVCLQQFLGKYIYQRHTQLHSTQYLFIRSVFSFSFFFLLMNYKFTHYMITGIHKHQFKHIIAKSLLGIIYISCLYTAIKYLPLVVASLI
jgi:drug/metabolite transporter (DMT)-like permease